MNATEAYELTNESLQKKIEDEQSLIPARIKLAASKGLRYCYVNIFVVISHEEVILV